MIGDTQQVDGRELTKSPLLDGQQSCSVKDCQTSALIVLGQKPLCLEHFIVRCYEWLDYLDPIIRGRICTSAELPGVPSMVEECSNRALLVSLRCEDLTNVARSRLLDILLLSSDLLFHLRVPRNHFPALLANRAKTKSRLPQAAFAKQVASSGG